MFLNRFEGCLLLLLTVGVAGAQTAAIPVTPPPVKMGLWETSVTVQVTGLRLPPEVLERLKQMGRPLPGAPHTTVTHGCLTPAEWQKTMEDMNKPPNADCKIANREQTRTQFSADVSCKSEDGTTMTGHWEMQVVDDENAHGSGHVERHDPNPNGQSLAAQSTIVSHYLKADCGDVKPGNAKVVERQ